MADKEEIIFILTRTNTIKDGIRTETHKDNAMTRQEAVEVMAKANWIATVCAKNQCMPIDISMEEWNKEWEKLRKDYKKVYYAGAEASLNALLEVIKKENYDSNKN